MHELSVTEGLIKIIVDEAEKRDIRKISRINLVIGDLASIVDDSVQFYYDILSKGTAAEGAVLFFLTCTHTLLSPLSALLITCTHPLFPPLC